MGVQSLQPPYLRPLLRFCAHELYVRRVFTSSTQPWWSLFAAMAVAEDRRGSLPGLVDFERRVGLLEWGFCRSSCLHISVLLVSFWLMNWPFVASQPPPPSRGGRCSVL